MQLSRRALGALALGAVLAASLHSGVLAEGLEFRPDQRTHAFYYLVMLPPLAATSACRTPCGGALLAAARALGTTHTQPLLHKLHAVVRHSGDRRGLEALESRGAWGRGASAAWRWLSSAAWRECTPALAWRLSSPPCAKQVLPHWQPHVSAQYPDVGRRFRPPEELHSPYYPLRGPCECVDGAGWAPGWGLSAAGWRSLVR